MDPKSLTTCILCCLFKCCANIISSYDKLVCAICFCIPNRTSMMLFASLFKYFQRKKKEKFSVVPFSQGESTEPSL